MPSFSQKIQHGAFLTSDHSELDDDNTFVDADDDDFEDFFRKCSNIFVPFAFGMQMNICQRFNAIDITIQNGVSPYENHNNASFPLRI